MKAQGRRGWKRGLVLLIGMTASAAAVAAPPWSSIGDRVHYALEGGGDALSETGASLTVQSKPGGSSGFGGAATVIDAVPYRKKRVRLSGIISAKDVEGTAGLWMRADGPSGSVAFANSERAPVSGNADAVPREIEIYVPAPADKLLVGPLLVGKGRMTVRTLRLAVVPSSPDDEVPPARIVDEAVRLIRAHALNAERIEWNQAQADIARDMKHVHDADAAYAVIRQALAKLGDRHSGLLPPQDFQRFSSEGKPSFTPMVEVRERVGIVSVPAFSGTDKTAAVAFANELAGLIAARARQAPCGWVVDLRGNQGGSMWPMLSGLYSLLGNATPGYSRDREGRQNAWKVAPPGVSTPDLSAAPVVVVTGGKTASSGEAVAIAFRGRPKTHSVGQPTFGVSTSNGMYPLPGGARLKLTDARFVDRTGQAYGDAVMPDDVVPEDEAVAHAVASLAGCAR